MTPAAYAKVDAKTAEEVCKRYEAAAEAKALLRPELTPRQYVDLLAASGLAADACQFLAHALPKREAVWWGCLCVDDFLGPSPPAKDAAALKAAQAWVMDPTDPKRRAAMTAAEAAGLDVPAGFVAFASFFSGGSIAPEDLPPVPPPEAVTGTAVAGAVKMAAVLKDPAKAPETCAAFLQLGVDVADGKNRWPDRKN